MLNVKELFTMPTYSLSLGEGKVPMENLVVIYLKYNGFTISARSGVLCLFSNVSDLFYII